SPRRQERDDKGSALGVLVASAIKDVDGSERLLVTTNVVPSLFVPMRLGRAFSHQIKRLVAPPAV
ncbi:hypothetical protein, partial [Pseudomonas nitroreducens]|uniref:hypothetical protein n=1 Tax=Pseudomonas nitroreducens TaxID=46680 RepID=UPI001FB5EF3F